MEYHKSTPADNEEEEAVKLLGAYLRYRMRFQVGHEQSLHYMLEGLIQPFLHTKITRTALSKCGPGKFLPLWAVTLHSDSGLDQSIQSSYHGVGKDRRAHRQGQAPLKKHGLVGFGVAFEHLVSHFLSARRWLVMLGWCTIGDGWWCWGGGRLTWWYDGGDTSPCMDLTIQSQRWLLSPKLTAQTIAVDPLGSRPRNLRRRRTPSECTRQM